MNFFWPTVAPRLFLLAFAGVFVVFFVFVVKQEGAFCGNICPAVSIKDSAIALGVE
ncbi:4Fe-4S binding protein [Nostoc sp. KVJ20]|uniref:4Fe-4S binding protein n=1 Tax=Nostoc sp. KVJ20 TaxID=457944 RepID=UPI00351EA571